MMLINKPTIRYCLESLFAIYQDRIEAFPDLTLEAQSENIEAMKQQAKYWKSFEALRVALWYLVATEGDAVLDDFIINWDDNFEAEEIRTVLKFALQTQWEGLEEPPADILEQIQFVNVPPLDWKRQKETL